MCKVSKEQTVFSSQRKPLLFKMTNRIVLFLFSFSLVLFCFYAAGNIQFFLDKNQKLLLNAVKITSILLLCFLTAGSVQILWYATHTKRFMLRFIALYVPLFIFAFLLFTFAFAVGFFAK